MTLTHPPMIISINSKQNKLILKQSFNGFPPETKKKKEKRRQMRLRGIGSYDYQLLRVALTVNCWSMLDSTVLCPAAIQRHIKIRLIYLNLKIIWTKCSTCMICLSDQPINIRLPWRVHKLWEHVLKCDFVFWQNR